MRIRVRILCYALLAFAMAAFDRGCEYYADEYDDTLVRMDLAGSLRRNPEVVVIGGLLLVAAVAESANIARKIRKRPKPPSDGT